MNYTILQQINPTFRVMKEENIKKEQYKTVYSGTIEEEDLNINQILENIFIKFKPSKRFQRTFTFNERYCNPW